MCIDKKTSTAVIKLLLRLMSFIKDLFICLDHMFIYIDHNKDIMIKIQLLVTHAVNIINVSMNRKRSNRLSLTLLRYLMYFK